MTAVLNSRDVVQARQLVEMLQQVGECLFFTISKAPILKDQFPRFLWQRFFGAMKSFDLVCCAQAGLDPLSSQWLPELAGGQLQTELCALVEVLGVVWVIDLCLRSGSCTDLLSRTCQCCQQPRARLKLLTTNSSVILPASSDKISISCSCAVGCPFWKLMSQNEKIERKEQISRGCT